MVLNPERKEHSPSFSDVLQEVVSNKDYLVGSEPEGSGWDFSDWLSLDFKDFKGWVLSEKFFGIPTIDGRKLTLRIIQTDPKQFPIEDVKVSFVISPILTKGFPTIFVGKDNLGKEVILRNKTDSVEVRTIPEVFQSLAQEVGVIKKSGIVSDNEAGDWAMFLKGVLKEKKVFPSYYGPSEFMVRDQLELGPDESYSEEDALCAEMQVVEQELLMYGYADFIFTQSE